MLQKSIKTKNKKIPALTVFAIVVLFLVVAELFWKHISISATNSVGYHVFYVSYQPTDIRKGEYAVIKVNVKSFNVKEVRNEFRKFKTNLIVKQIACVPGDNLTVKGYVFYCNGKFLARAKKTALDGEKLTHFKYNGIIPKGFYFAYGKDKNSFDSRYFGFVSRKEIVGIAYPIF